jgi:hypothetical protein
LGPIEYLKADINRKLASLHSGNNLTELARGCLLEYSWAPETALLVSARLSKDVASNEPEFTACCQGD